METDVPALEWCSAHDAALWIMLKRRPIAFDHRLLMKEPLFSFEDKQDVMKNLDYPQSWAKLHEAASQGIVQIRGRPVFGIENIAFDLTGPSLLGEKSGDTEEISPEKIREARVSTFIEIATSDSLVYRRIYATEPCVRVEWAYVFIEMNFFGLKKLFHPAEGKAVRVDTDVKFLESEDPQTGPLTKTAISRNANGRPSKWDWKGVLNATWAAIYAETLKPDPRINLNQFMEKWFSKHQGDCPEHSQIRAEVKKLLEAMKAADDAAG